jgi:hypothetical protein
VASLRKARKAVRLSLAPRPALRPARQILFYPTAIGSEPQDSGIDSYPHWTRTMLGHAAANLVRPPLGKPVGAPLAGAP